MEKNKNQEWVIKKLNKKIMTQNKVEYVLHHLISEDETNDTFEQIKFASSLLPKLFKNSNNEIAFFNVFEFLKNSVCGLLNRGNHVEKVKLMLGDMWSKLQVSTKNEMVALDISNFFSWILSAYTKVFSILNKEEKAKNITKKFLFIIEHFGEICFLDIIFTDTSIFQKALYHKVFNRMMNEILNMKSVFKHTVLDFLKFIIYIKMLMTKKGYQLKREQFLAFKKKVVVPPNFSIWTEQNLGWKHEKNSLKNIIKSADIETILQILYPEKNILSLWERVYSVQRNQVKTLENKLQTKEGAERKVIKKEDEKHIKKMSQKLNKEKQQKNKVDSTVNLSNEDLWHKTPLHISSHEYNLNNSFCLMQTDEWITERVKKRKSNDWAVSISKKFKVLPSENFSVGKHFTKIKSPELVNSEWKVTKEIEGNVTNKNDEKNKAKKNKKDNESFHGKLSLTRQPKVNESTEDYLNYQNEKSEVNLSEENNSINKISNRKKNREKEYLHEKPHVTKLQRRNEPNKNYEVIQNILPELVNSEWKVTKEIEGNVTNKNDEKNKAKKNKKDNESFHGKLSLTRQPKVNESTEDYLNYQNKKSEVNLSEENNSINKISNRKKNREKEYLHEKPHVTKLHRRNEPNKNYAVIQNILPNKNSASADSSQKILKRSKLENANGPSPNLLNDSQGDSKETLYIKKVEKIGKKSDALKVDKLVKQVKQLGTEINEKLETKEIGHNFYKKNINLKNLSDMNQDINILKPSHRDSNTERTHKINSKKLKPKKIAKLDAEAVIKVDFNQSKINMEPSLVDDCQKMKDSHNKISKVTLDSNPDSDSLKDVTGNFDVGEKRKKVRHKKLKTKKINTNDDHKYDHKNNIELSMTDSCQEKETSSSQTSDVILYQKPDSNSLKDVSRNSNENEKPRERIHKKSKPKLISTNNQGNHNKVNIEQAVIDECQELESSYDKSSEGISDLKPDSCSLKDVSKNSNAAGKQKKINKKKLRTKKLTTIIDQRERAQNYNHNQQTNMELALVNNCQQLEDSAGKNSEVISDTKIDSDLFTNVNSDSKTKRSKNSNISNKRPECQKVKRVKYLRNSLKNKANIVDNRESKFGNKIEFEDSDDSELEILGVESNSSSQKANSSSESSDIDEASGSDGDIIPCDENNRMFTPEETKFYHEYLVNEAKVKQQFRLQEKVKMMLSANEPEIKQENLTEIDEMEEVMPKDNKNLFCPPSKNNKPQIDLIDSLYKKGTDKNELILDEKSSSISEEEILDVWKPKINNEKVHVSEIIDLEEENSEAGDVEICDITQECETVVSKENLLYEGELKASETMKNKPKLNKKCPADFVSQIFDLHNPKDVEDELSNEDSSHPKILLLKENNTVLGESQSEGEEKEKNESQSTDQNDSKSLALERENESELNLREKNCLEISKLEHENQIADFQTKCNDDCIIEIDNSHTKIATDENEINIGSAAGESEGDFEKEVHMNQIAEQVNKSEIENEEESTSEKVRENSNEENKSEEMFMGELAEQSVELNVSSNKNETLSLQMTNDFETEKKSFDSINDSDEANTSFHTPELKLERTHEYFSKEDGTLVDSLMHKKVESSAVAKKQSCDEGSLIEVINLENDQLITCVDNDAEKRNSSTDSFKSVKSADDKGEENSSKSKDDILAAGSDTKVSDNSVISENFNSSVSKVEDIKLHSIQDIEINGEENSKNMLDISNQSNVNNNEVGPNIETEEESEKVMGNSSNNFNNTDKEIEICSDSEELVLTMSKTSDCSPISIIEELEKKNVHKKVLNFDENSVFQESTSNENKESKIVKKSNSISSNADILEITNLPIVMNKDCKVMHEQENKENIVNNEQGETVISLVGSTDSVNNTLAVTSPKPHLSTCRTPSPYKRSVIKKRSSFDGCLNRSLTPLKVADAALSNEIVISPDVSDEENTATSQNVHTEKENVTNVTMDDPILKSTEEEQTLESDFRNIDDDITSTPQLSSSPSLKKNSISGCGKSSSPNKNIAKVSAPNNEKKVGSVCDKESFNLSRCSTADNQKEDSEAENADSHSNSSQDIKNSNRLDFNSSLNNSKNKSSSTEIKITPRRSPRLSSNLESGEVCLEDSKNCINSNSLDLEDRDKVPSPPKRSRYTLRSLVTVPEAHTIECVPTRQRRNSSSSTKSAVEPMQSVLDSPVRTRKRRSSVSDCLTPVRRSRRISGLEVIETPDKL